MNTLFRFLLSLAAALVPAWGVMAQGTVTRSEGKILILDSYRAMEGDVARVGDRICLRRDVGEVWLAASKVRFIAESWDEAVAFMKQHANLLDPDERLRLARWCHGNGLHQRALDEINATLQMRPEFAPAVRLQQMIQRTLDIAQRPQAQAVVPKSLAPPPSLDLNAESMGVFVTKIQPILMNTCARCHSGGQGGNFQLRRVHGNAAGSRIATRYNLATVMQHVRADRPELSRLLIKAVSAHGRGVHRPPIKSRRAMPYVLLKQWVDMTLASNPHLKENPILLTSGQSVRGGSRETSDVVHAAPTEVSRLPRQTKSPFAAAGERAVQSSSPRPLPKFAETLPAVGTSDVQTQNPPALPSNTRQIPIQTGQLEQPRQKTPQPRVVPFQSPALPPLTKTRDLSVRPTRYPRTIALTPVAIRERESGDAYSASPFNEMAYPERSRKD